ncbi:MAG: nuclear transport factor 2 family protein [Deltaproteobacteria bacterium]|nr:nuclear transport factor 2 family protein [Deltaproteobacteria bacterium]
MKGRNLTVFWIVFLLTIVGCRQSVTDLSSEKKAVQAVIDNYAKSWITEDIELYSSTMMPDDSLIHVGGSKALDWIEGWTELREIIVNQNQSLNDTDIDEKKSWINFSQSGKLAWAVTLWDLTTTLNDGTECLLPLRCTWILEKKDGSWIIVHFHKSIGIKTLRDYALQK